MSDDDFRLEWFSGTGCGGQHRNKKQNSLRCWHIPTGLVETRQGRKRETNLAEAKAALLDRLKDAAKQIVMRSSADDRKAQIGSGMRGDKSVTIRFQDDRVVNHRTGKVITAVRYMKGYMDEAW